MRTSLYIDVEQFPSQSDHVSSCMDLELLCLSFSEKPGVEEMLIISLFEIVLRIMLGKVPGLLQAFN